MSIVICCILWNRCTSPNDSDDEFSELPPWRQGANEGGGWSDGLRRSIDELRSRAVIPSSELRQPSDDTGQPSDNPRSSDNTRSSVDPRDQVLIQGDQVLMIQGDQVLMIQGD